MKRNENKNANHDGWHFGAENGIRTRDLNLGKVALYQLSYFRLSGLQRYIFFTKAQIFSVFYATVVPPTRPKVPCDGLE